MTSLREVDDNFQSEPNAPASSGGAGGDGSESRLARLEPRITYLATKKDVERINVQLKTRSEYLATKEDIQKIKVWVLGGVLGAMAVGGSVVFGILRLMG